MPQVSTLTDTYVGESVGRHVARLVLADPFEEHREIRFSVVKRKACLRKRFNQFHFLIVICK